MKLEKVKIQNYRSVARSDLPIDSRLTTLVGANEHGKTNLLWAIRLLDFKTPIKESDKRISKTATDLQETEIIYDFELSDSEKEDIENSFYGEEDENSAEDETSENNESVDAEGEDSDEEDEEEPVEIPSVINLKIKYNDGDTNTPSILNEGLKEDLKEEILSYLQSSLEGNIFYFDTFEDRLKHRIPKEEIVNKNDDITNGLLKLAGLTNKESVIFEDTSVARQLLLNGARELTKQLKSLWVQGKEDDIEVKFSISHDGNFLNIDIEDFNTYGDVSTRSRGFLFFLAFILKFKEYHDGDLEDFIFLIDEPGIFLHPRGQKDLLLYLEKLAVHNQLIYTTHSPFMINRLNNFRVRVISKDKEKGTQIDMKPYIHNWKSLRASLGMMLADSFYYADNNLIVEGPADRLYILTLLKTFHEKNLIKVDLNILSIIDSGGCPNVPTMVQIVKSEERPLVVLVDSDNHGNHAKTAVLHRGVKEDKIKQVGNFRNDAITIEDLLPRKYLNKAINAYIDELTKEGICKKPEKAFNSTVKNGVVDTLKKYLKDNNCGVEEISKLNIARHFEEIVSRIDGNDFKKDDFDDMAKLIKWISEVLKIKIVNNP